TRDAMPSGAIFLRPALEPADRPEPDVEAVNGILQRLNETRRARDSGALESSPLLHGLLKGGLNRMIVDFPAVLNGDARQDVALLDGDQVFVPRRTDSVCVVGEVASCFSTFHVRPGDRVRDVLRLAGGYTRNA